MRTIPTLTAPTPGTDVSAPTAVPAVVLRHPAAVIMDDDHRWGARRHRQPTARHGAPRRRRAEPLAGYRDPNAFGTDPGRACVMLTRHRAHLTVVTDTATPTITTHRALLVTLPTT